MKYSTRVKATVLHEHADDTLPVSMPTQQQIAQAVRADISQMFANCWELQQLNQTAPKAHQRTINKLALPTKARLQQQVTHHLHDVCDFAKWTTEQLARRRAVREVKAREEQLDKAAQKEALQGWHRHQAQLRSKRDVIQQQQLTQQQLTSKQSAALVTQRAKQDLLHLREKQDKQKLHAHELRANLAKQQMITTLR